MFERRMFCFRLFGNILDYSWVGKVFYGVVFLEVVIEMRLDFFSYLIFKW